MKKIIYTISQKRKKLFQLLLILLLIICSGQTLKADEFWKRAKAYSAAVTGYQLAKDAVEQARTALADAEHQQTLKEIALETVAKPEFQEAAAAALTAARLAVAAAAAKLALAVTAAEAAAAVVAGLVVGTMVGEGVDWCISWFWDPVHPLNSVNPSYVIPTDNEIDLLIPTLLNQAGVSNLASSKADFDAADIFMPGVGTAAWNYMHSATKCFIIALKGAAAYSGNLCNDVKIAKGDLELALTAFKNSIANFSSVFASATIYTGNPITYIDTAIARVLVLNSYIAYFPNPTYAAIAINDMIIALNNSRSVLLGMSTPTNTPRPLEGNYGYFPVLTLQAYLNFLNNCASIGSAALPPGESTVIDGIMSVYGLSLPGQPSAGPTIAGDMGQGDTGNESGLFGTAGLRPSQQLITSVTHHWNSVNLCTSPLWLACGGTACNTIPTLSEWGLILLSLLLITIGSLFIRKRRMSIR